METPTGLQGVTNYVRGQTVVNSNSPNPFLPKIRLNAFYGGMADREMHNFEWIYLSEDFELSHFHFCRQILCIFLYTVV